MSDINEMNVGVRWYVAHTYSGYENKVKASLEKIIENRGLGHLIFDIRIPVETIVETDGDSEKEVENKIVPSYVLVKMVMTDESWHVVRNITGVTGFVGPGSEPTPLTDDEIEMFNIEARSEGPTFQIGDMLEVVSGIFQGYKGKLQKIDEESKQVVIFASKGTAREMSIFVDIKDVRVAE